MLQKTIIASTAIAFIAVGLTQTAEASKKKARYNFSAAAALGDYTGKKTVSYETKEKPGTIIVNTKERKLYFVLPGGKAIQYGVGVGRPGFTWSGVTRIARKAKWPTWRPPAAMRKREPNLPAVMKGGLDNPLGARALYLYKGGRDTLYRLHGTADRASIGRAVSSGCIRLLNEEVKDLYERAKTGTKVIVL